MRNEHARADLDRARVGIHGSDPIEALGVDCDRSGCPAAPPHTPSRRRTAPRPRPRRAPSAAATCASVHGQTTTSGAGGRARSRARRSVSRGHRSRRYASLLLERYLRHAHPGSHERVDVHRAHVCRSRPQKPKSRPVSYRAASVRAQRVSPRRSPCLSRLRECRPAGPVPRKTLPAIVGVLTQSARRSWPDGASSEGRSATNHDIHVTVIPAASQSSTASASDHGAFDRVKQPAAGHRDVAEARKPSSRFVGDRGRMRTSASPQTQRVGPSKVACRSKEPAKDLRNLWTSARLSGVSSDPPKYGQRCSRSMTYGFTTRRRSASEDASAGIATRGWSDHGATRATAAAAARDWIEPLSGPFVSTRPASSPSARRTPGDGKRRAVRDQDDRPTAQLVRERLRGRFDFRTEREHVEDAHLRGAPTADHRIPHRLAAEGRPGEEPALSDLGCHGSRRLSRHGGRGLATIGRRTREPISASGRSTASGTGARCTICCSATRPSCSPPVVSSPTSRSRTGRSRTSETHRAARRRKRWAPSATS